jgi:hypothetical protein
MPTDRSGPEPALLRHLVDAVGDVVDELVARGRAQAARPSAPGTSGGSRRSGTSGAPGPASGSAGAVRLSDAERDSAAEVLRDAYAEGRLDLAEFEDRLSLVHAARVRAELPPILADLPRVAADGGPAAGGLPGWVWEGAADGASEVITAVLREVRRTGRWEVPPRLRVLVRAATVVLDLREARVRSDVVEIDVRVTAGRILVIVPPEVAVEVRDGLTVFGTRSERTGSARSGSARSGSARSGGRRSAGDPAAPRVVIGGQIIAGRLVVRTPTLRERWRAS